jgi:hypothetical protein
MKREPVVIVMAVLAGLQVLVAGAAFTEAVPQPWAGLAALVVAAIQVAVAFWVRGEVVPLVKVDRTGAP